MKKSNASKQLAKLERFLNRVIKIVESNTLNNNDGRITTSAPLQVTRRSQVN